jgi:hypothetical protein
MREGAATRKTKTVSKGGPPAQSARIWIDPVNGLPSRERNVNPSAPGSCYRRLLRFASARAKTLVVKVPGEVRHRYGFAFAGC